MNTIISDNLLMINYYLLKQNLNRSVEEHLHKNDIEDIFCVEDKRSLKVILVKIFMMK
jgi:hypothetical protein